MSDTAALAQALKREKTVKQRGFLAPVVEYDDGSTGLGVPGVLHQPYQAMTRLMQHGYNPAWDDKTKEGAIGDAFDASGLAMAGSLAAPRPRGSIGSGGNPFLSRIQAQEMFPGRHSARRGASTAQFAELDDGAMELRHLWTDPNARGQGAARGMLDDIVRAADDTGTTLQLTVDPEHGIDPARLQAFYESAGFGPTGEWFGQPVLRRVPGGGSIGSGGRPTQGLDMSEAARLARAREMGFDTPVFHATRSQFTEVDPNKGGRSAFFTAATPDNASRGATAGQNELARHFAAAPDTRPQTIMPLITKSSMIDGLSLTPSQRGLMDSLPERATLAEYEKLRPRIEQEFGTVPPWLYDDGELVLPGGRVLSYDDLRKMSDAEFDAVKGSAVEYLHRGSPPAWSYADAVRTGRDINGRQIAHWGPTADEAATAKRINDSGMGGYLVQDEAGVTIAITDPSNIRSVNAAFDPAQSSSANLLAANNPKAVAQIEGAKEGIRAYHGSPHSFDKFDMSKIGTGEGAQAYGHGLYFAESEDVARSYRNQLAPKAINDPRQAARQAIKGYGDNAMWQTERAMAVAREKGDTAELARLEAILSHIKKGTAATEDGGGLYEVRINADPADFLDWDKPLSQQSEAVRSAFNRAISPEADAPANKARWGAEFGQHVLGLSGNTPMMSAYKSFVRDVAQGSGGEAANKLRDAGIPGIRYLDQNSRAAGQGTSNYVVFDEGLIEILRKYGILGALGLGAASQGGGNAQAAPSDNREALARALMNRN